MQQTVPLENSRQKKPPNSDKGAVVPPSRSKFPLLPLIDRTPLLFYFSQLFHALCDSFSYSPSKHRRSNYQPPHTILRTKRVIESNYEKLGPDSFLAHVRASRRHRHQRYDVQRAVSLQIFGVDNLEPCSDARLSDACRLCPSTEMECATMRFSLENIRHLEMKCLIAAK